MHSNARSQNCLEIAQDILEPWPIVFHELVRDIISIYYVDGSIYLNLSESILQSTTFHQWIR